MYRATERLRDAPAGHGFVHFQNTILDVFPVLRAVAIAGEIARGEVF